MMHNPTAPAVRLETGGEAFSLRFDMESIAIAEDITGRALLTGLTRRDVGTPTINLVRAMLFACLLPDSPDMTFEKASSLVTRKTLADIWGKVLEAWGLGLAEPEKTEDTSDPLTSQS